MRLLTATSTTQGQRPNDFHFCVEGELVMPPLVVCARDQDDPDGGCGCGRGFAGLNSHQATTTAMVRDVDGIDHDDVTEAVRSSLDHGGWLSLLHQDDISAVVADVVADVLALADEWPAGTVLERRLEDINPRRVAPT